MICCDLKPLRPKHCCTANEVGFKKFYVHRDLTDVITWCLTKVPCSVIISEWYNLHYTLKLLPETLGVRVEVRMCIMG